MKKAIMIFFVLCAVWTMSCTQQSAQTVPSSQPKKLKVITTLFPLYDFARTVADDKADVILLLPPGSEAHSFDPKPSDVVHLAKADIFVYTNNYMEPWAEKMLQGAGNPNVMVVDTSAGIPLLKGEDDSDHVHGGGEHHHESAHKDDDRVDPHVWLDFRNAATMVRTIRDAFISKDRENAALYRNNADSLLSRLATLDARYETMIATCRTRELMSGGHFAFGYLAHRYGLQYHAAYGFSPSSEPSPRDLMRLSRQMRRHGIKYIFHEELIEPRVAEAIAQETGSQLLLLHGAHNISKADFEKGETFLQLMEKNYETLRKGLECK
ncbi:MAG TPA: zinc ABC transporter substrate-binding protein [Dissulfurispiraceae bacterium]|nr:zinc ABC transporter substrate-binding protein [Dissulfurispiraceae bacterium]